MIKAVFWDFGGVITSSPFESFNRFEKENELPLDFLRSVNSTNPDSNAWALLERSEINLDQFDSLFEIESKELGHSVKGKEVIALLKGQVRPEMIRALKKITSEIEKPVSLIIGGSKISTKIKIINNLIKKI